MCIPPSRRSRARISSDFLNLYAAGSAARGAFALGRLAISRTSLTLGLSPLTLTRMSSRPRYPRSYGPRISWGGMLTPAIRNIMIAAPWRSTGKPPKRRSHSRCRNSSCRTPTLYPSLARDWSYDLPAQACAALTSLASHGGQATAPYNCTETPALILIDSCH